MGISSWKRNILKAEYGTAFYKKGERKITLNFALADGMPVNPDVLLHHFSPDKFIIKITPVNPTCRAIKNEISSHIIPDKEKYEIIEKLKDVGYDVYLKEKKNIKDGYTYSLQNL